MEVARPPRRPRDTTRRRPRCRRARRRAARTRAGPRCRAPSGRRRPGSNRQDRTPSPGCGRGSPRATARRLRIRRHGRVGIGRGARSRAEDLRRVPVRVVGRAHEAFTAERSIAILTSSPTRKPPDSSARCQVSPNAVRSIVPRTLMPMRSLPQGSRSEPSTVASSSISRVTSLMRQIADHPEVRAAQRDDAPRFEACFRIALGVEEVGPAQMLVPGRLVRVDARRPDNARDLGVVDVIGGLDRSLEVPEASANGRDHHVLDRELDARMRRIDVPGARGHADDPLVGVQVGSTCSLLLGG